MFAMLRIKSNRITPATLVLVRFLLLLLSSRSSSSSNSNNSSPPMAMPGCQDYCGNISIPYPFGIGPNSNCFLNSWYRVICDTSESHALKFATLNWKYTQLGITVPVYIQRIEITTVSLQSTSDPLPTLAVYSWTRGTNLTVPDDTELIEFKNLDMRGTPFALVPLLNTLAVDGIGGTATLRDGQDQIVAGCTTFCPGNTSTPQKRSCYGMGCCKTSVPTSLDYFSLQVGNIKGSCQLSWTSNLFYDVVETSYFSNSTAANATYLRSDTSAILQWKLQDLPSNVPNKSTAFCTLDTQQAGYYCRCNDNYLGNPYLPQGCQGTSLR